jgi:hypothetical protein
MTTWTGTWRNQYGSRLTIVDEPGGRLRDGRIETMWHVAADRAADGPGSRAWPHAVMANADTFERVAG